MTYAELAESRGISRRSAERLAQRRRWPRRPGNDGTARVGVPAGAEKPTERQQGDAGGADQGDAGGVIASLRDAFATALGARDGEIAALRGERDAYREQVEGLRQERDRALADLQAAQIAHAESKADAAALRQADESRKARGRWRRLRAAWRGALLLVALPVAAHAQPLPDWPIDRLCQEDQSCVSRNVSARNFLRDKTWQQASAQKRAECLKWEAKFYRRYRPELSAAERYMNLYMCADGAIAPKR